MSVELPETRQVVDGTIMIPRPFHELHHLFKLKPRAFLAVFSSCLLTWYLVPCKGHVLHAAMAVVAVLTCSELDIIPRQFNRALIAAVLSCITPGLNSSEPMICLSATKGRWAGRPGDMFNTFSFDVKLETMDESYTKTALFVAPTKHLSPLDLEETLFQRPIELGSCVRNWAATWFGRVAGNSSSSSLGVNSTRICAMLLTKFSPEEMHSFSQLPKHPFVSDLFDPKQPIKEGFRAVSSAK
jgi:hypothetical protein